MKLIVQKLNGIFNFCESSDGIEYDGNIYGGSSVKLSYTNDTLVVDVDGGERNSYPLADLNYDDGTEIIGFASMNEFIIALKDAGFTGNFNTPQAGGDVTQEELDNALLLKADLSSPTFTGLPSAPTATLGNNTTQLATTAFVKNAVDNASSTFKTLPSDVTTTLATAQTITDLNHSLDANSTYIVRGNLRLGCSGSGGVKLAVTYPTSAIAVIQAVGQGANITSSTWVNHSNASSGVLQNAVSTSNTVAGTYIMNGTIKTGGTAGNLIFSFASTTAGQTSNVYTDGSFIEIIKIS